MVSSPTFIVSAPPFRWRPIGEKEWTKMAPIFERAIFEDEHELTREPGIVRYPQFGIEVDVKR